MQDLAHWLEELGMSEYAQRFADNGIDVSVLPHLTDQDLKDVGVLLGHRRKMLAAIAQLRGTLQKLDGNTLTIATKGGKEANVPLKDGAPVIAVTKGALSDIKSNTFVGITAMPQPDGTQKAVEVHVFEEPLRGTGEGHYPWDLMPNSTMTNGAVA